MNFVFISPYFPHTYWNFCDRLKKNGVNVLGIGDAPYDSLEAPLKAALTEYYRVDTLESYEQVFRAVAFFSFKYSQILKEGRPQVLGPFIIIKGSEFIQNDIRILPLGSQLMEIRQGAFLHQVVGIQP